MSLHIGDKIIEVNGTPLQNHSLEEVSLLLFEIFCSSYNKDS